MSVAYEGELLNVDAFNQPGVEARKRIMELKLQKLKAKISLHKIFMAHAKA